MILTETLENFKIKFVYVIDKKEVAFVIIEDVIDVINIIDVFVSIGCRRLGIASKLLEFIFNYFSLRNVKYMLEVRRDNLSAIGLYEKYGFKSINVRKKYYGDMDAIIMEVKK